MSLVLNFYQQASWQARLNLDLIFNPYTVNQLDWLSMTNNIQTKQLARCCSVQVLDPDQNPDLLLIKQVLNTHLLWSFQRVANQEGLPETYLPSYRHTWFQLGVYTYKQLSMEAYWSGSAMLTASQGRHKLLMNDIQSSSLTMTKQFRLKVFKGRRRSDSGLFWVVNKLKHFKAATRN